MNITPYSRQLPQISVSMQEFIPGISREICFSKCREKSVKKLGKIIIFLEDDFGCTLNTLTNVNTK
jgi:hypothetical protein